MKVYKRRKSKWWYVVNGDGRKKNTRKATSLLVSQYSKREAQKIMDMAGQKAFLRSIGMKETHISLDIALDEYNLEVIRLQGDTPHSKAIRGYVNNFIKYTKNNRQNVGDVKTSDVEDYLVHRRENGTAPSTLTKDKTFINQFFEMCETKKYIDRGTNPCKRIRKRIIPSNTVKNQKRVNEPIPDEVLFKIMYDESIPSKERLLWKIQRFTGFDVGNALHIQEHNINRSKKEIHCEREKTKEKTSWIPLADPLVDEDIINLQSRFNQKTTKGCIRKRLSVFRKSLEKVGYTKYVTFKCLRHSFNQWLAESGVEDTIRHKLMGHDLKQNATYTHLNTESLREKMNEMVANQIPN